MIIARQTTPMTMIFKTRFESCWWKDRAEVGPFCRKGLRSIAATCDQKYFDAKIMSPEITGPLFISPCDVPLTVRLVHGGKQKGSGLLFRELRIAVGTVARSAPPLKAEVIGQTFFVRSLHSLFQTGFIPAHPDPFCL